MVLSVDDYRLRRASMETAHRMFYDDPRVLSFQSIRHHSIQDKKRQVRKKCVRTRIRHYYQTFRYLQEQVLILTKIFRQMMVPAADRFKPQLMLVSAGSGRAWKETEAENWDSYLQDLISNCGFCQTQPDHHNRPTRYARDVWVLVLEGI